MTATVKSCAASSKLENFSFKVTNDLEDDFED